MPAEASASTPIAAPSDETLADSLREQLVTHSLSKALFPHPACLIDCLDDHGFYSALRQNWPCWPEQIFPLPS